MKHLKIIFVVSTLAATVIFFARCMNGNSTVTNDARGDKYAGSRSCISCHKDISNSFAHSNHYKTSSAVHENDIVKLVSPINNNFYFMDSSQVIIEKKDGAFVQSYFVNGQQTLSGQFDIAFGSGEKAQTFAYWKQDKLFQLSLTYFAAMNSWINSPGFTIDHANYNRIIESRCFECHASYVEKEFVQSGSLAVSEKMNKNSIIFGIDCERCHGPAAEHVKYQQENPTEKKAMFITPITALNRQQQLDVCGVCHSGNDQSAQRSVFSFLPGDTLSHFYFPDFGSSSNDPDVHGKQMQLLQASKCFQLSKMTCTTCHNPHEANNTAAFITTCMNCHQNSVHAVNNIKENEQAANTMVVKNCIDCHMPLQPSKTIYFNNSAGLKNISYFLRTHKIAIYR